jgi:hypothetical protein
LIMKSKMNRFVTSDDLTRLIKKASLLSKLAESAQQISLHLDEDKRNIKTARESPRRGRKWLRKRDLTKRQRGKIERKIEYHGEWLHHTEAELKGKHPSFSEAISQIERVLRELAETYESLATVQRFEHGPG